MAYRPTEWNSESAATISIQDSTGTYYFFDAILKADHVSMARATEHPVQTGANTSDHIFNLADQLTLDIGMSDVMDCFTPGQFSGDSKSVAAYEQLQKWKEDCETLSIITRLNTYENMFIETMFAPDDFKTLYGLKCSVHFREIMLSEVKIEKVSTKPQVSEETNKGNIQAEPVKTDSEFDKRFQAQKEAANNSWPTGASGTW